MGEKGLNGGLGTKQCGVINSAPVSVVSTHQQCLEDILEDVLKDILGCKGQDYQGSFCNAKADP